MNEQKANIIKVCWELFFQFGIKSVTMDDIAQKMGMSKKTIYQHFTNKTELVEHAIEWQIQNPRFSFESEEIKKLNAIDQFIEFYKFITEQINKQCSALRYDLKKYFPKLYRKFHVENVNNFQVELATNLKQGITEELFRKEINIEFISKTLARIYLNMIQTDSVILEPEDIMNIEYHKELATYHLYGICTDKGIEYFQNKLK